MEDHIYSILAALAKYLWEMRNGADAHGNERITCCCGPDDSSGRACNHWRRRGRHVDAVVLATALVLVLLLN